MHCISRQYPCWPFLDSRFSLGPSVQWFFLWPSVYFVTEGQRSRNLVAGWNKGDLFAPPVPASPETPWSFRRQLKHVDNYTHNHHRNHNWQSFKALNGNMRCCECQILLEVPCCLYHPLEGPKLGVKTKGEQLKQNAMNREIWKLSRNLTKKMIFMIIIITMQKKSRAQRFGSGNWLTASEKKS